MILRENANYRLQFRRTGLQYLSERVSCTLIVVKKLSKRMDHSKPKYILCSRRLQLTRNMTALFKYSGSLVAVRLLHLEINCNNIFKKKKNEPTLFKKIFNLMLFCR